MARPRSEKAREKALAAAVGVAVDSGVARFSVDEVARRSGVAKTTIYRNWPTRQDLLFDALNEVLVPDPTPDTGSLVGDIKLVVDAIAAMDAEVRRFHRKMFSGLLAASIDDAKVEQLYRRMVEYRTAPLRASLERARDRGEVQPDVDLNVAADMIMGAVLTRVLVKGETFTADEVDHLMLLISRAVGRT